MLKNPNKSNAVTEVHVLLSEEMAERLDSALTLPDVKSKTQLIMEGLDIVLKQRNK